MRPARHLPGEAVADIAGEPGVDAGMCEDMVDEHGGGSLAVRTGDTYHSGVGISSGKLYLADYRDVLFAHGYDDRRIERYAGAFHNLVGVYDLFKCVSAFLEGNALVDEGLTVFRGYFSRIAQENVHALVLCQNCGSGAALSGAEDNEASLGFVIFHVYRILRVTNVTTARMMPMIQKRVTIFCSAMARRGRWMRASMPALPSFWK